MPEPGGVLITRPAADAAETARRVAALGWTPVIAPVLRIVPGRITCRLPVDALVLTSRNAVPALPEWYRDVPVLAVGRATAARAREAGFVAVQDADGDASDLAALVRDRCRPRARLLLAHGRGRGVALAADLRQAGFRVRRRCAYAVVAAHDFPETGAAALFAGEVRSAMFLSAETARAFVRLLPAALRPRLQGVDAVAIGSPAAEFLTPLPWRRLRVSVGPTLDHVLALI